MKNINVKIKITKQKEDISIYIPIFDSAKKVYRLRSSEKDAYWGTEGETIGELIENLQKDITLDFCTKVKIIFKGAE